jgi:DNA-binding IclR family transcriptional regulator
MKRTASMPQTSKAVGKAKTSSDSATETVELSLRVLERLASSREPIGVSELARGFDASKATIYRHLQALARHGFVHQEASTSRYTAGIKLFILGEQLRERFDVLAVGREDLMRLREDSGQPVTVSALVENQVVILEVLQSRQVVNFGTQPGTVLDLHASAHGNIALAFGSAEAMAHCLARPRKAWTLHTICSPTGLKHLAAQVRAQGWAVAAPLFTHSGGYAGAVAIAGSVQYIPASPPAEQIRMVTQTAERISRKLGWRGR